MERPDRPPRIHRITRGKKVNRSLLRTGVLAPLAALAVLAAAPAQARTGDGGPAATPASSASSAASTASEASAASAESGVSAASAASGGPVTPAPAAPSARTAPAEIASDLGVSRIMRRCDATAHSALRDATTIAAGGAHAVAAPRQDGLPERPPAGLRAPRTVPNPAPDLTGAATKQVSGVSGALAGQAKDPAKVAAGSAAPLDALPSAGRARDVAADCAAAEADPVRRLTGPVPGALFGGPAGPGGVIPERSLS
jgi:hypothetical protein